MSKFSKSELTQMMQKALEAEENILAAWVGGSSATGAEDDYSDIDLAVICEDQEELLKQHVINHIWQVEESVWKNFFQKFYDFGLRYLYRDLDGARSQQVEGLRQIYFAL